MSVQTVIASILAIGILTGLPIVMEKRDQRREYETDARHSDKPKHQRYDGTIGGMDHPQHPTEEQHRSAEQKHWRWQVGIGIFTLAFAAIAAGGAIWTYIESARQADAAQGELLQAKIQTGIASQEATIAEKSFRADHSPSITVTVKENDMSITHWELQDDRAFMTPGAEDVEIVFSNTGRIPAVVDSAECRPVLWPGNDMTPDAPFPPFTPPTQILSAGEVINPGDNPVIKLCSIRQVFGLHDNIPAQAAMLVRNDHDTRYWWMENGYWILASVRYHDSFGIHYRTTVCARYNMFGFDYVGGEACNKQTEGN